MHSVWEAIESGRQITKEEEASSLYLRQVFDHFLWCLAKSARPNEATFDNPLPLTSIEEPHMRNAVLNKSEGRSYSEGAWILLDRVKNDQRVSRKLRHRASSGGAGTSDTKRKYGSEEGPNANDADSKPRYYKKIKREKGSGPEQQQTITGEMNDSTAEHHQPADQEEQPLEDDLTDTDSTLSNISSSSSEEEPLRDSRTPGSSRPLAARPVDEQPSSSKKVQFGTPASFTAYIQNTRKSLYLFARFKLQCLIKPSQFYKRFWTRCQSLQKTWKDIQTPQRGKPIWYNGDIAKGKQSGY